MGEFMAWLVVGTFILAALAYAWPVFVLIGGVLLVAWIARHCIASLEDGIDNNRQRNAGLIARADQQHAQIVSGDEIGGTYGIYQPPQGLR